MRAVFSHQLVEKVPELGKRAIYLFIHLLFGTTTMFVAALLFYSWISQFVFLSSLVFLSAYNASAFYFPGPSQTPAVTK